MCCRYVCNHPNSGPPLLQPPEQLGWQPWEEQVLWNIQKILRNFPAKCALCRRQEQRVELRLSHPTRQ